MTDGMSAWATYKSLRLRMKIAVALAAPLWLPVAFTAWLSRPEGQT